MRQRLPLALSAAALVVALFGATPLGHAAVNAVRHALYADNAGKVNGFKASRTPQPNALLALDRAGEFPASVIPTGLQGPKGDKGDKGDPGPPATGLFAAVSSTGALIGASGVTGNVHNGTGNYTIEFNRDVSHCAVLASPFNSRYRLGASVLTEPTQVVIFSHDAVDGTLADAYFSLAVFC